MRPNRIGLEPIEDKLLDVHGVVVVEYLDVYEEGIGVSAWVLRRRRGRAECDPRSLERCCRAYWSSSRVGRATRRVASR